MKKQLLTTVLVIFTCNLLTAQVYMYGTTYEGGQNGLGTIYRVGQYGTNFEKVFDFNTAMGGNPSSGLTLADGLLYGFTSTNGLAINEGASVPFGSFFKFNPKTKDLTVIEFLDDKTPFGFGITHAPILGKDGLLYAMSTTSISGGIAGPGYLFSYNPNSGQIITIASFGSNGTYGQCTSKLMQASNGLIYIITSDGGTGSNAGGEIVTYNPSNQQLNTIHNSNGFIEVNPNYYHEFAGATNNPLYEGSNGTIYGQSKLGGDFNLGLAFRFDPSGSNFIEWIDFNNGITGQGFYPSGGYIEDNGYLYSSTLYGMTTSTNGTFYRVNMSNSNVQFFHTLDVDGAQPLGTFVKSPSPSNRLYITCSSGGANNYGSIIEYDPSSNTTRVRHEFAAADGVSPKFDGLTVVDFATLSVSEINSLGTQVNVYPNPAKDNINIKYNAVSSGQIKLFSVSGALLKTVTLQPENNIDVSNLSSGFYVLNISTEDGNRVIKKIILE